MARTRRETRNHKYYTVTRDEKGRFVGWKKWKRSDPSTWVKPPPEEKPPPKYICGVLSLKTRDNRGRWLWIDIGIVAAKNRKEIEAEIWRIYYSDPRFSRFYHRVGGKIVDDWVREDFELKVRFDENCEQKEDKWIDGEYHTYTEPSLRKCKKRAKGETRLR